MMSAASLTCADNSLLHQNILAEKLCALSTAVEFVLHVRTNGLPLAVGEKMAKYKPFEFVRSTFPGYKNVISNVRDPERVECVMLAAKESDQVEAAKTTPS